MKSETIRARVQPDLKHEVETILKGLGLNATEAITMFYQQIKLHRGIPFEIKFPNEETLRTFVDTDARRNLTTYESVDAAFDALDSKCTTSPSPSASRKITPAVASKAKTSRSSKKS